MTLSPIFRHCLLGKTEDIQKVGEILRADPAQLNATLVLPLPDSDKSVTLTPVFLAAIAASTKVVRLLIDAGATLRSETGEDLFTWTCMCPWGGSQSDILDIIFDEKTRPRVHPDLPEDYRDLFGGDPELDGVYTQALAASRYPLSPFNVTVLNNNPTKIKPGSSLIASSSFRGMTPLELATYRVAVCKLLSSYHEGFTKDLDPKLLFLATQLGDREKVRSLAGERKGNDLIEFLSAELYKGMTPAYIAARYNRVNILEFLNGLGVDLVRPLTSGPKNGITPLCAAASLGHVETLEFYRLHGIDLSQAIPSGPCAGWTPAYYAACQGQVEVLDFLERCKIDLTLPLAFGEREGKNLAIAAASVGRVDVLRRLEKVDRRLLFKPAESGSVKGQTPLYVASIKTNIKTVKYLVGALDSLTVEERNKFSQPITGEVDGENLASLAVRKGQITVLKKLINDHADWLFKPLASDQSSLAFRAANEGNVELLECLRLLGLDLSLPENCAAYQGATPMFAAAFSGKTDAVKYLNSVCNINPFLPLTTGKRKGISPVFTAANHRHTAVLQYVGLGASEQQLIERFRVKEPVDGKSPLRGLHPFHLACLAADVEGVKACYDSKHLDLIADQSTKFFGVLDFVLYYKGPRLGPCDTREQNQVKILQFLMKILERFSIMAAIKNKNRPRIYQALLTEPEILLERVLLEENFLKRILSGQLTVSSQQGRILWRQANVSREITPDLLPHAILRTIDSFLSKNEISNTLLPPIVEKFEQIIATAHDQFTTASLSMTDEQCRFLCSLLETLEHVSHELAMPQVGGSFPEVEPPTVVWEPNSGSNDKDSNPKRRRAESLPPLGASTSVTGKRKRPG